MTHFYKENKLSIIAFLFLVLLWGTAAAGGAPSKHIHVSPEPSWVAKLPLRTSTPVDPNKINGGFHYLLLNTQTEVAQEENFRQVTYKLLTEEGVQNSSELRISFDPSYEKLQLHKVQVWRKGKWLNKLDLAKVKVIQREQGMDAGIYDESLTAVLVLDDIRVGDIVDYSYTTKGFNPAFSGKYFTSFNLQQYDPIDEMLVRLVVPRSRQLQFKYHLNAPKPEVKQSAESKVYTWHRTNVPATQVDSNIPEWYDPYPGVYVSEFKTWRELAAWAMPLYQVRQAPSKALQAKIDSIKAQTNSVARRLEAALHFVQDEVRYLGFEAGIGGYQPHMPSEVFANHFGDCKDKSLLLAYMLQQMNIKASPALVNSTLKGHIQELLPSPYAFNHCIVRVELKGGQVFWYDPTISKQRGDYSNIYVPAYGLALVLAPGSNTLAPVTGTGFNGPTVKVREIYHIDEVGQDVVLEVRTEYFGSEADFQRSNFATTGIQDIEKNYLNFYAKAYPEIELKGNIRVEDNERANTFIVFEDYRIPGFWQPQHQNSGVLEAWFSPLVFTSYISQLQSSKRTMPMAFNHPVHIEQSIRVLLPQSWPVNNETQEVEDDAFSYTKKVTYSPGGTELDIDLTYRTKADHVAPEATATYLRNQGTMLDNMVNGVTYNKDLISKVSDFRFSWGILILSVLLLAGFGFGAYKLYFWDPANSSTDEFGSLDLGGWVIVPLIGLFFTPLGIIGTISSEGYFNASIWEGVLSPDSAAFSLAGGLLFGLEFVANLAFFVLSVVLIVLYLKRRASVPRLMVIFYGSKAGFILFELALAAVLSVNLDESGYGTNTLRAIVGAAIWIPYFLNSSRVKSTFVERHERNRPESEWQQNEQLVNYN